MKIDLPAILQQDLTDMAIKRKVSTQELIIQMLANDALIEKFISPDDASIIMAIYAKYLPKKH